MKTYKWLNDMPDYSQDTFTRIFKTGAISTDSEGAMAVKESSIQPIMYIDRLTGGHIEKLPELIKLLENPEIIKLLQKSEG